MIELVFSVEVKEGWPPVEVEAIWCVEGESGYYLKNVPFFVKGLSVGDKFSPEFDPEGRVVAWNILSKSDSSIMWIMINHGVEIHSALDELKKLGCNIEELKQLSYCAVEIPGSVSFSSVNEALKNVTEDMISYAFPVFRHGEMR